MTTRSIAVVAKGTATIVLAVFSAFVVAFNFVSGIAYTWLKFDVLDHSAGTGVIPGPWFVVPIVALLVLPAGVVLGLVAYGVWRVTGRRGGFIVSLSIGFLVASVVLHIWVVRTILLDADLYTLRAAPLR